MQALFDHLKALDMHFTGKVMAVKAVEAQKGAFNRGPCSFPASKFANTC